MLTIEGIEVSYGKVQALWGVSCEVAEREIVSLVGANGAGKTTLLKTISGLLRPAAGTITWGGEYLDQRSADEIVGLGVIHVPEGRKLFPFMSVLENLLLGSYTPRARGARGENLARVFEIFPLLKERQEQLAGTLSGGEQQMLAIGRGLMASPRLLMLDEPSLGLAPLLVEEMFAVIERIHAQGVAILLVEQNTHHALSLATRGYVLENGRVVLSGTGAELLASDRVKSAYLGM